jgi:hypothetical protein
MFWSELSFGKHKGKTLPQVLLKDPSYFFWAIEEEKFDHHPALAAEGQDLNFKVRHVKIPKLDPQCWRVHYVLTAGGEFEKFELIPTPAAESCACPDTFLSNHLDLSLPMVIRYTKAGNRRLIQCFKQYFFGGSSARLTREKCGEFFSNPENFLRLIPHRSAASAASCGFADGIGCDAWCAELEEARLLSTARRRRRLEQTAKYSPRAAESLALEMQEDRSRQIMAGWGRKSSERATEADERSTLTDPLDTGRSTETPCTDKMAPTEPLRRVNFDNGFKQRHLVTLATIKANVEECRENAQYIADIGFKDTLTKAAEDYLLGIRELRGSEVDAAGMARLYAHTLSLNHSVCAARYGWDSPEAIRAFDVFNGEMREQEEEGLWC